MSKDKKDIFTLYGTDNVQYAKYNKEDAEEIIIPKEVAAVSSKKQRELIPDSHKKAAAEAFLDFAESLGGMYIGVFKRIIRFLLPVLLLPAQDNPRLLCRFPNDLLPYLIR